MTQQHSDAQDHTTANQSQSIVWSAILSWCFKNGNLIRGHLPCPDFFPSAWTRNTAT